MSISICVRVLLAICFANNNWVSSDSEKDLGLADTLFDLTAAAAAAATQVDTRPNTTTGLEYKCVQIAG